MSIRSTDTERETTQVQPETHVLGEYVCMYIHIYIYGPHRSGRARPRTSRLEILERIEYEQAQR